MPEKHPRNVWRFLFASALILACATCTGAQTFKVLYNFTGGADGGGPWSRLVMDKVGNLYGTTAGGGAYGYGEVFELSPNSDGTWTETVLHSFMLNDPDGQEPFANLIFDAAGNLYGTTSIGGKHNGGTAFELTPGVGGWSLTLLYTFESYKGDAAGPSGGLIMDAQGNLYGAAGGGSPGAGTVYELSPGSGGWTDSVLYNFGANKGLNGNLPVGNLIFDPTGNLYGATYWGGDLSCGHGYSCGLVYKLIHTPNGWKETVLHAFTGPPGDGQNPEADQLALDPKGNVYGTTISGGGTGCGSGKPGCGTIFKLIHSQTGWKETFAHTFGNGANGYSPTSGLTFDQAGNAYGVTAFGGAGCGCGVVYKLVPGANGKWTYSVLHAFTGADGAQPVSGVILDASGNLYGTALTGGSGGAGVVYEITP